MAGRIAKSFGLFVLMVAWAPFLACNLLGQIGGSNSNQNDNGNANANGNGDDNTGTSTLAVFVDPDSSFSTSDVHDVNDEIVQFDTVDKTLIWAADGTAYQGGSWDVNGVLLAGGGFKVLFGTKNGDPRAYFTETVSATICDIGVQGGQVSIVPTTVAVPHD